MKEKRQISVTITDIDNVEQTLKTLSSVYEAILYHYAMTANERKFENFIYSQYLYWMGIYKIYRDGDNMFGDYDDGKNFKI